MEKLILPDIERPSEEVLENIKKQELEELNNKMKQIDTETIIGRLEANKLWYEYKSIEKGKELSHHVYHIDENTGMKYIHNELTDYGKLCNNIKLLKQSGLLENKKLNDYRIDNFDDRSEFSVYVKQKALQFLEEPTQLFAVLGQSGVGKSHICTAMATEFIKNGYQVKYMLWKDEVPKIKFTKDLEERNRMMERIKSAEVLYIDDLLKVDRNNIDKLKDVDIDIALEIIFNRYMSKKITIITSEFKISDLQRIDEGMASRLVEMADGYIIEVEKDSKRNERL